MAETPVQAMGSGPISQQNTGIAPPPAPLMPVASSLPVTDTAQNVQGTLTGVNPTVAQTIAKAISVGLAQMPTNEGGWAQLVDRYSNLQEADLVNAKVQAQQNQQQPQQPQGAQQPAASNAPATPVGSEAQWAATVLQRARLPVTQNNVDNMMRWMTAEEPSSDWSHASNPLNINAGGSGFDTFPSLDASATATANVIRQSNMNGIFTALAGNATPGEFSAAVVASPWAASHYGGDPNHIASIAVPASAGTAQVAQTQAFTPQYQGSNSVVNLAQQQIGTPYVWGGEDPSNPGHKGAFDCSGLVQWVYGQAGTKLPRVAQAQYDATAKIAKGAPLQPGDLLFFGSGPNGISHVGIYVGNGMMIDAPHTGADVREEQIFKNGVPTWADYVGATRPGDPSGMSTVAANTPVAQTVQKSNDFWGKILGVVTQQLTRFSQPSQGQLIQ